MSYRSLLERESLHKTGVGSPYSFLFSFSLSFWRTTNPIGRRPHRYFRREDLNKVSVQKEDEWRLGEGILPYVCRVPLRSPKGVPGSCAPPSTGSNESTDLSSMYDVYTVSILPSRVCPSFVYVQFSYMYLQNQTMLSLCETLQTTREV